jgi:hypothetical protein
MEQIDTLKKVQLGVFVFKFFLGLRIFNQLSLRTIERLCGK